MSLRLLYSITIALAVALGVAAPEAQAKIYGRRKAWVSATSQYSSYADLKRSSASTAQELDPSLGVELDLRIASVFSLLFVSTKNEDSTLTENGFGIRAGLPGFFFFFKDNRDVRREAKLFPVETSLYFYSTATTSTDTAGVETEGTSTQYGLTIDVFLFNPIVYLRGQYGIYNMIGDSYTVATAGLGAQF